MQDPDYKEIYRENGMVEAPPRVYRRDVETAIQAYRSAHDAYYRAQRMNLPPTIATLVGQGWQSAKDNLIRVMSDRQTQPYLADNLALLLDVMAAPLEKE